MKKTTFISAGAKQAEKFDDLKEYVESDCRFPTKIIIKYGQAIEQIGLCYKDKSFPLHGKTLGNISEKTFELSADEHIIKITGDKALYWNNDFLFSIKFHTDKGRILGVDNNFAEYPVTQSFEISFDDGYALGCLCGEIAPPKDAKYYSDRKFLSGIGAYQIAIDRSRTGRFAMYAESVTMPGLNFMLDHTGVNVYYKNETFQFKCYGEGSRGSAFEVLHVNGNLDLAIIITTGKINQKRENNIFGEWWSDRCGISYGLTGVCHQMTNRILYAANSIMPISKVWGAKFSHLLYGAYGRHWENWKWDCCVLYRDFVGGKYTTMEEKPITILKVDDKIPVDYELTEKLLEIESKNLSENDALKERIKLMLDVDGEQLNEIYNCLKQPKRIVLSEEPVEAEKQYLQQSKDTLVKINQIVGDEKFKCTFNCSLHDIE